MKPTQCQLVQRALFCAIAFALLTACPPAEGADLSSPTPAATPTATELLDKYAAALDHFRSVIIKAETSTTYTNRLNGLMGAMISGRPGTSYGRVDCRNDGKRFAMQYQSWGDCSLREVTPMDNPGFGFSTWDGAQNYSHTKQSFSYAKEPLKSEIATLGKATEGLLTPLNRNAALGEFRGYLSVYRQRIDVMVRRARSISVRPKTEIVNGSSCYVIDATTDYGKFCLWIDPAHGYLASRITLSAGPGDLSGQDMVNLNAQNMTGRLKLPPGATDRRVIELLKFEQKGDVWVPMEIKSLSIADMTATREFEHNSRTYKLTEVQLNPDHNALRSFDWKRDPELKDGTAVWKTGERGVVLGDYLWKSGNLVRDPNPARLQRGREVR